MPSLSPDRSQGVYQWNGDWAVGHHIYALIIDQDQPLRLTQHPASERWPKWSFDGRWKAYVLILAASRTGLYRPSPIGGSEEAVTEISDHHI